MVSELFYYGLIGGMVGLYSFLSNRSHLLTMLLSLEYVSVSLFIMLAFSVMTYVGEDYLLLYYLVMIVCEGVLGLGVIVSVVRLGGNDYFSSFSLLKC